MISVYEAANTIEAHMILNLLEQAGISGIIAGEHLQSGVGELPASGLIRVQVEEEDASEARAIIAEWEANEPTHVEREPAPRHKNSSVLATLVALVAGIAVGASSMYFYYRTPVTTSGIDYTGDGLNEERWYYAGGRLTRYEADRNQDGHIDLVHEYDRMGLAKSAQNDDGFDGRFEATTRFHKGNPVKTQFDIDGDGVVEQVAEYEDGILQTITWFDPIGLKFRKKQYWDSSILEYAELDTDGDGIPDTVIEYDDIEEITKKSNKPFNTEASKAGSG